MAAVSQYDDLLSKFYEALPQVTDPVVYTVLDVQLVISILAITTCSLPFVLIVYRYRRESWPHLSFYSLRRHLGTNSALIVPAANAWVSWSALFLSIGNCVCGVLLKQQYQNPLHANPACFLVFATWVMGCAVLYSIMFSCAIAVLTTASTRSVTANVLLQHPRLLNAFVILFPIANLIAGIVVASILHSSLHAAIRAAQQVVALLEGGRSGTITDALPQVLPVLQKAAIAYARFDRKERGAMVYLAVSAAFLFLVCTLCMIHLLRLSRQSVSALARRLAAHRFILASAGPKEVERGRQIERRRLKLVWRHRLIVTQWVVALAGVLALTAFASYGTRSFQSVKDSQSRMYFIGAASQLTSSSYLSIVGLVTWLRMCYCEDVDTQTGTDGNGNASDSRIGAMPVELDNRPRRGTDSTILAPAKRRHSSDLPIRIVVDRTIGVDKATPQYVLPAAECSPDWTHSEEEWRWEGKGAAI